MTRPRVRHPRATALGAALLGALACREPVDVGEELRVTLEPNAVGTFAGDSVRIRVVATPSGAVTGLRFTSTTPLVATVDSTGLVRTHDVGAAVIDVDLTARGGHAGRVSVPVTVAAPCQLAALPAGGEPSLVLGVGGRARPPLVVALCRPGADSSVVLMSADTTVAGVSGDGMVVGQGEGTAVVTARLRAAPSVRVAFRAVVLRFAGFPPSLTVTPQAVALAAGDSVALATNVALPPGAPDVLPRGAGFSSSDTTVATVTAEGVVRGRRPGQAVVTVYALAYPEVFQTVAVTVTPR